MYAQLLLFWFDLNKIWNIGGFFEIMSIPRFHFDFRDNPTFTYWVKFFHPPKDFKGVKIEKKKFRGEKKVQQKFRGMKEGFRGVKDQIQGVTKICKNYLKLL